MLNRALLGVPLRKTLDETIYLKSKSGMIRGLFLDVGFQEYNKTKRLNIINIDREHLVASPRGIYKTISPVALPYSSLLFR